MHVVGVVGPDGTDLEPVVDRLVAALGEHGTVGTVSRADDPVGTERRDAGAAVSYELGADAWTASGDAPSLHDSLDHLARTCDHAVVTGFPEARVPQVVVGGVEAAGDALVEVDRVEEIDVEAVLDALADVEPYETLGSLVRRAKASPRADRSGAIATFTGRVRAKDAEDDARTTRLEFEKYAGVAEERLATIREELESREGVFEVRMHHRTGVIEDGEDIVFVVVLAGHREEAFRTVEDGINRLKDEVPIFKKEITVDDEFWVHDRP